MAELPEIEKLSRQMESMIAGKQIKSILLQNEKQTNIPPKEFYELTRGAIIEKVHYKGKWLLIYLNNEYVILISPGMGADILYFPAENEKREKHHVCVTLTDGTGFTVRYWWFGKFILWCASDLKNEPHTKNIAIDPFSPSFTYEHFCNIIKGKKKSVKSFLLDQKNVSGIGNMYMHDILFTAGLHPQKKLNELDQTKIKALYDAILKILLFAREKGAFQYDLDFFGKNGDFTEDDFLVGYKEGKPCVVCGEAIIKIKTGSTSSYICPRCQAK